MDNRIRLFLRFYIVPFLDIFYIYLQGDLALLIKNAGKKLFSESVILHWFVQLALGLHYMHNKKVLHRDIKTQNIFLVGTRRLVLGDLGISKVLLLITSAILPYQQYIDDFLIFKNRNWITH